MFYSEDILNTTAYIHLHVLDTQTIKDYVNTENVLNIDLPFYFVQGVVDGFQRVGIQSIFSISHCQYGTTIIGKCYNVFVVHGHYL